MQGSNFCSICEGEFTPNNPCWNSYATFEDGSHVYTGDCAFEAKTHYIRDILDGKLTLTERKNP
jgi:hypothetical protein